MTTIEEAIRAIREGTATELNLGGRSLGDEGTKAIAEVLRGNRTLQKLELGNNQIGDEGAKSISAALAQKGTLQTLDLRWNEIGTEGAQSIGAALTQNGTLQTLDLGSNAIGAEGAKSIGAALEKNGTLQVLDLGSNKIGAEGAYSIGAALAQSGTLQTLKLRGNGIGADGAKTIGAALEKNGTLQALDLGWNEIGTEGAKSIRAALAQNGTLQTLKLRGNKIGAEGANAIGAALEKNGTLRELELSNNHIGDEGAKSIGAALEKNGTLQTLDLGSNRIGAEGARLLGAALEKNGTLQTLDLESNMIEDEGAKLLGAALKKKGTLQSLILKSNWIGDEGAKAIGVALEKNSTLQTLVLGYNEIWAEGAKAIGAALEKNGTLRELELSNNHIGDEGAKSIGAALEKNGTLQRLCSLDGNWIGGEGAKSIVRAVLIRTAPLDLYNFAEDAEVAHSVLHGAFDVNAVNVRSNIATFLRDSHIIPALIAILDAWEQQRAAGEPLIDVPFLVVERGPEAVRGFIHLARESGIDPTPRLTLCIIGRKNSGKTSLLSTLVDEQHYPRPVPKGGSRATTGVAFTSFELRSAHVGLELPNTRITVLDFGGQTDYEQTHTLFHRNKGLYIIVVDLHAYENNDDHFNEHAGFFFEKMVASTSGASFVVVGSKAEDLKEDVMLTKCEDVMARLQTLRGRIERDIREVGSRGTWTWDRPQVMLPVPKLASSASGVWVTSCSEAQPAAALGLPEFHQFLTTFAFEVATAVPEHSVPRTIHGVQLTKAHAAVLEYLKSKRKEEHIDLEYLSPKTYENVADWAKNYQTNSKFLFCTDARELNKEALDNALMELSDVGEILWYKSSPSIVFPDPGFLVHLCRDLMRHDMLENSEGLNDAERRGYLEKCLLAKGGPQDGNFSVNELKALYRDRGLIPARILTTYFPGWDRLPDVETAIAAVEPFGVATLVHPSDLDELCVFIPGVSSIGTAMPWKMSSAPLQTKRRWSFRGYVPWGLVATMSIRFASSTTGHQVRVDTKNERVHVRCIAPTSAFVDAEFKRVPVDVRVTHVELCVWGEDVTDALAFAELFSSLIEQVLSKFPGLVVVVEALWTSASGVEDKMDLPRIEGSGVRLIYADAAQLYPIALADWETHLRSKRGREGDEPLPQPPASAAHTPTVTVSLPAPRSIDELFNVYKDVAAQLSILIGDAELFGSLSRRTAVASDLDIAIFLREDWLEQPPSAMKTDGIEDRIRKAFTKAGKAVVDIRHQSHSFGVFLSAIPGFVEKEKVREHHVTKIDVVPLIRKVAMQRRNINCDFVANFTEDKWELTGACELANMPTPALALSSHLVWVICALKAWKVTFAKGLMDSTHLESVARNWYQEHYDRRASIEDRFFLLDSAFCVLQAHLRGSHPVSVLHDLDVWEMVRPTLSENARQSVTVNPAEDMLDSIPMEKVRECLAKAVGETCAELWNHKTEFIRAKDLHVLLGSPHFETLTALEQFRVELKSRVASGAPRPFVPHVANGSRGGGRKRTLACFAVPWCVLWEEWRVCCWGGLHVRDTDD